jgi:hypothetical protein
MMSYRRLGPMYCLPGIVVPLVVFQSFLKGITAQIHTVLVVIHPEIKFSNVLKSFLHSQGCFVVAVCCIADDFIV